MPDGNVSLPQGWTVTFDSKTNMYIAKSPDGSAQITYPEQEIGKILVNGRPVKPAVTQRLGEGRYDADQYDLAGLMGATFTLRGENRAGITGWNCESSTIDVKNGRRHDSAHFYGGSGNTIEGDSSDYVGFNGETKHPNRTGVEYQDQQK